MEYHFSMNEENEDDEFFQKMKEILNRLEILKNAPKKHVRTSSVNAIQKELFEVTSLARLDFLHNYSLEIEYYELCQLVKDFKENNLLATYIHIFEYENNKNGKLNGAKVKLDNGEVVYNFFYVINKTIVGKMLHIRKAGNSWEVGSILGGDHQFMLPIIIDYIESLNEKA